MRFFLLILLVAASVSATPLVVTAAGTFSNNTPASGFSQPGGAWSLSFDVSSKPTVSNVSVGNGFDTSYSNFTFDVNGSPVATPVADIRVFNSSISGLFSICFLTNCPGNGIPSNALVFEGAQAYTGDESSPTILPGVYDESLGGVLVNDTPFVFASESPVVVSAVGAPEPSSLLLIGAGLSAIGMARKAFPSSSR